MTNPTPDPSQSKSVEREELREKIARIIENAMVQSAGAPLTPYGLELARGDADAILSLIGSTPKTQSDG